MDLNRVAVFVRVVEVESFTKAAEAMGLPKSSVSRSVASLEEELGVRLLQRTTRKLSLTEAGRAFFERSRAALSGLEEAASAATDTDKIPSGVVRMTAPVDAGVAVLAGIVARFVEKHPRIRVEVSLTGRVVDLVEEGFDLALRAGKLRDSALVARRVGVSDMGIVASAAYLQRHKGPRTLAELAAHDCVLFRSRGGRATWQLTGPDGEVAVDVRGVIEADELSFVVKAVAEGAGLALVPLFVCTEDAGVVRVLPEYLSHGGAVFVVSPERRYEPLRVTVFREFLTQELLKQGWDGPPSAHMSPCSDRPAAETAPGAKKATTALAKHDARPRG